MTRSLSSWQRSVPPSTSSSMGLRRRRTESSAPVLRSSAHKTASARPACRDRLQRGARARDPAGGQRARRSGNRRVRHQAPGGQHQLPASLLCRAGTAGTTRCSAHHPRHHPASDGEADQRMFVVKGLPVPVPLLPDLQLSYVCLRRWRWCWRFFPRILDVEDYLDYITNRVLPDLARRSRPRWRGYGLLLPCPARHCW